MKDLQLVYCPPEEANDDKEAPDTGGIIFRNWRKKNLCSEKH